MKPPKSSEGGLWPGIWMDASKADTVRFTDCRFTEIENGVALKLNGAVYMNNCKLVGRTPNKASTGIDFAGGKRLQIQNSTFSNLNTALRFNAGGATDRHLYLTRNKFSNNLTSIELSNGLIDFQLRCNEFTTPNPAPTGQTRYGLKIGEDAILENARIGGNGQDGSGPPNGNYWPISDPTWNLTTSVEPQPVSGFISIQNQTDNLIRYWSYHNEFVGNMVNTGSGNLLLNQLTPTTYMWTPQTLINRCQQTNNCGAGGTTSQALQACTTAILQGRRMQQYTARGNTLGKALCRCLHRQLALASARVCTTRKPRRRFNNRRKKR
jgi:hypothetical protein